MHAASIARTFPCLCDIHSWCFRPSTCIWGVAGIFERCAGSKGGNAPRSIEARISLCSIHPSRRILPEVEMWKLMLGPSFVETAGTASDPLKPHALMSWWCTLPQYSKSTNTPALDNSRKNKYSLSRRASSAQWNAKSMTSSALAFVKAAFCCARKMSCGSKGGHFMRCIWNFWKAFGSFWHTSKFCAEAIGSPTFWSPFCIGLWGPTPTGTRLQFAACDPDASLAKGGDINNWRGDSARSSWSTSVGAQLLGVSTKLPTRIRCSVFIRASLSPGLAADFERAAVWSFFLGKASLESLRVSPWADCKVLKGVRLLWLRSRDAAGFSNFSQASCTTFFQSRDGIALTCWRRDLTINSTVRLILSTWSLGEASTRHNSISMFITWARSESRFLVCLTNASSINDRRCCTIWPPLAILIPKAAKNWRRSICVFTQQAPHRLSENAQLWSTALFLTKVMYDRTHAIEKGQLPYP